PLGVLEGALDGLGRFFDVRHDAAAHARGARLADAEDLDARMSRQVALDLGDEGGGLGRADVEASDETFRIHCGRAITWSRKRRSISATRIWRRASSASTGSISANRSRVTSLMARTGAKG